MSKNVIRLVIALLFLFTMAKAKAVTIKTSCNEPCQGQTFEITLSDFAPNDKIDDVEFLDQKTKLFLIRKPGLDRSYHALVTVPVVQKPGSYPIKYNDKVLTSVSVKSANFTVQKLTLPKSKDNFVMSPGEENAINKAKSTLTDTRYFTSPFIPPVKARVSTQFGLRRIVNGKLLDDYFHSGIDYAANLNTPIKATGPGNVILTGHNYKLHGNTVCIDHGQGVISIYIHMNKILVKDGQKVKQGDIIGTVGQTGRANGPHLHFSIYVNTIASNPKYWYKDVF